jgi:hypothetical protein
MPVPNIQMRDMDAMNSTTQQKYPKKKKTKKVVNNVPVKKNKK